MRTQGPVRLCAYRRSAYMYVWFVIHAKNDIMFNIKQSVELTYGTDTFLSYSDSWPVKMGPTRPETSVNSCHTTPRNIPEERRSHVI
jgi:hypothetical protein